MEKDEILNPIKKGSEALPDTAGGRFAHSIKMWIDQNVWDLIPQEIANQVDTRDSEISELKTRVQQLLSCLDYGKMTDYQLKVVGILENLIKEPEPSNDL